MISLNIEYIIILCQLCLITMKGLTVLKCLNIIFINLVINLMAGC